MRTLKRYKIYFTESQMSALIDIIETIESMHGCGDNNSTGEINFDIETEKSIRKIDLALKYSGYKRTK